MASDQLKRVLHPQRFPGMSGKMAALVGHILGMDVTEPALREVVVTSDRCVLARREGDCGCNEFIGDFGDLQSNWERLLNVTAEQGGNDPLTPELREEAESLFATRIRAA